MNLTFKIVVIDLSGLAILIVWPFLKHSKLSKIPAPIMVLLVGMGLGQFFGLRYEHPHFTQVDVHKHLIATSFLVPIPDHFSEYFY